MPSGASTAATASKSQTKSHVLTCVVLFALLYLRERLYFCRWLSVLQCAFLHVCLLHVPPELQSPSHAGAWEPIRSTQTRCLHECAGLFMHMCANSGYGVHVFGSTCARYCQWYPCEAPGR